MFVGLNNYLSEIWKERFEIWKKSRIKKINFVEEVSIRDGLVESSAVMILKNRIWSRERDVENKDE